MIDKEKAINIIINGKNDNAFFGTTKVDEEVVYFLKDQPTIQAIPLERIRQTREEIYKKHQEVLSKYGWSNLNISLEILDKLIAENEG